MDDHEDSGYSGEALIQKFVSNCQRLKPKFNKSDRAHLRLRSNDGKDLMLVANLFDQSSLPGSKPPWRLGSRRILASYLH